MSGQVGTPKLVVSGAGRVGAPADPLTALKWRANSHPAVQAVDAKINEWRARRDANDAALRAERVTLDAEREAAVKTAMREMVG